MPFYGGASVCLAACFFAIVTFGSSVNFEKNVVCVHRNVRKETTRGNQIKFIIIVLAGLNSDKMMFFRG